MSAGGRAGSVPVIALDGLSGSGKSTLARQLAKVLGWAYLDSGAWYRALAWACRRQGVDCTQSAAILELLSSIEIHGHPDGTVVVDGHPLHAELRTPDIDRAVADVADPPSVRAALTERMQRIRQHTHAAGVVADGRDAATVIFPKAELKVFVDATVEARASRRLQQQRLAGHDLSYEEVLGSMRERDARDRARGASAPQVLEDSRVLETTHITVEEAVGRLLDWAKPWIACDSSA